MYGLVFSHYKKERYAVGADMGTREKMTVYSPTVTGLSNKGKMLERKPGKRKKRNSIGEQFVPITKYMIKSPAFKQLTNASRVAYLLLKAQIKQAGQHEVIFPYSHAEPYMTRHTFARSVKQLLELGFIEKSDFGGLYRRTNVYRFVEGWKAIK